MDPQYTVSANVNRYSQYGKEYAGSSKKLKIELPHDPKGTKGYQRNISCKDGLDKGQKWYGTNRSRRY